MAKTIHAHVDDIDRRWHLIDASGRVLGRLATEVAVLLRGKHKPIFSPHLDTGDFVVIVNAERVVFTGKKLKDKVYYRHSGYPGGLKTTTAEQMLRAHPTRILEAAVRGMLPKTKLGDALFRKLKVYAGPDHPHASQRPTPFVKKPALSPVEGTVKEG
jgi:large subunit ribosomal protein L13